MVSQITSVSSVDSNFCSGTDQRKHQSSASLAFLWGIHRWPANSPHKGPVTRKMFTFDDVIMSWFNGTRQRYQNTVIKNDRHQTTTINNKTFRKRQQLGPVEIRKCKHWLSVAISNNDLLHCSVHHPTNFQADCWNPPALPSPKSSTIHRLSRLIMNETLKLRIAGPLWEIHQPQQPKSSISSCN